MSSLMHAPNDYQRSKPPKKRRLPIQFLESSSSESDVEVLTILDDDESEVDALLVAPVAPTNTSKPFVDAFDGNVHYLDVLARARQQQELQLSQSNRSVPSPESLAATQPTMTTATTSFPQRLRQNLRGGSAASPMSSMEIMTLTAGTPFDDRSDRIQITATSAGNKKRKVSMSPTDSLAFAGTSLTSNAIVPGSLELDLPQGKLGSLESSTSQRQKAELSTVPTPAASVHQMTFKLSKVEGNQSTACDAKSTAKTTNKADSRSKSTRDGKKEAKTASNEDDKGVDGAKKVKKPTKQKTSRSNKNLTPADEPKPTKTNPSNVPSQASCNDTQKKPRPMQKSTMQEGGVLNDVASSEIKFHTASAESKTGTSAAPPGKEHLPPAKKPPADKSQAPIDAKTNSGKKDSAKPPFSVGENEAKTVAETKQANQTNNKVRDIKQNDSKTSAAGEAKAPAAEEKSKTSAAGKAKASAAGSQLAKKKKLTFQDQVLRHMLIACKPFSLKLLAKSLNSTETALSFLMLSLVDKQLVIKKEFVSAKGASKELYWANQECSASRDVKSVLQPIPVSERKTALEQLQNLQQQLANLSRELAVCTREPSNEDLANQVQQENEQVTRLQQRLSDVRSRIQDSVATSTTVPAKIHGKITKARNTLQPSNSPRRLKLRINAMRDTWKQRKEKCMDFCDQLADGMEKKVKDVVKLLDVETDEMAKVTLPTRYIVNVVESKKK